MDQAFEPVRRYGRYDPRVLEVIARTVQSILSDVQRRFGDQVDVTPLVDQLRQMRTELDLLATVADRERVRSVLDEVLDG